MAKKEEDKAQEEFKGRVIAATKEMQPILEKYKLVYGAQLTFDLDKIGCKPVLMDKNE